MNCTDIEKYIDTYLDNELGEKALYEFNQHLTSCKSCAAQVANAESVLSGLQQMVVPSPSADFEQRVFSKVRQQYKDKPENSSFFRFTTGFATAAVAGLAILFVATVYQPLQIPDQNRFHGEVIDVSIKQANTIRLVFDAEKDLELVNLTIELPVNMELDGYPDRKTISWTTSLVKGQNVLALPVIAIDPGQGELIAQLNYGDKRKEFRILLKSSLNGVWQNQLNRFKAV